jgi:hypothetical protein
MAQHDMAVKLCPSVIMTLKDRQTDKATVWLSGLLVLCYSSAMPAAVV